MKATANPTESHAGRMVERNISALIARRKAEERRLGWQERLAERISRFAGSMRFVWLHLAIYGSWTAVNLGWVPALPRFDPTFVILAMTASVEALFLSTFILIAQNRSQAEADRRADLSLQVSLLAEKEITHLVRMVSEIGARMDVPAARQPELDEMKKEVRPEQVLKTIEDREPS